MYAERYILSFVSDRGNDYKIVILQQGYVGAAEQKKLGAAPSLSIEEGDGRIKGSSLAFSIQADVEGELQGLYTTNNKEFKVYLYRNETLYWQGYLLPELYSENYIDPPCDVAVTATDQLATLKDVVYQGEDVQTSVYGIMQDILAETHIALPIVTHLQITADGKPLLQNSYISAAAMNGKSCYDALNALLLSCNACLMQNGNEWLVTSLTDASTTYLRYDEAIERPHITLGQMHRADVYPDGSLQMVNAPAYKGATVEYAHILKNSMLKNADCKNRDNWSWTPYTVSTQFPSEIADWAGTVHKCYAWALYKIDFKKNASLHLWQDIELKQDANFVYNLSFKYLMTNSSDLLLLAVMHIGDDGVTRRLTANGWESGLYAQDKNSYIEVTGKDNPILWVWDIANISNYEEANVSFTLPEVSGKLRVGFINYGEIDNTLAVTYITQVYLTLQGVSGRTSTTLVEQNATTAQEEVVLSYGDKQESANAPLLVLNTLNSAASIPIENWLLSGKEFSSYFLMMLQDLSRYYGSKRMQLQGNIMGLQPLQPYYDDVFSGKTLRLVSAQMDLLEDVANVIIEEVPVAFVDYDTVVYATDNAVTENQTTGSATVVGGGGESYLSLQSDGDVNVKNNRPLTGREARFEQLAIPQQLPAEPKEGEVYAYVSGLNGNSVDLTPLFERVNIGTADNPEYALVPKKFNGQAVGVVSDTFITAGGRKSGQGSPTEGATTLGGLVNVEPIVDKVSGTAKVLIKPANGTHWTIAELSELVGNASNAVTREELEETEEVTAAAITDLNRRLKQTNEEIVTDYTSRLSEIAKQLNQVILDNEEVTAAAITDLNRRVNELFRMIELLNR